MHHFEECLLDDSFSRKRKQVVIELFTAAHHYLALFVQGCPENQNLLYEQIDLFLHHLKYDLGQV
jgi:hypothetical protein